MRMKRIAAAGLIGTRRQTRSHLIRVIRQTRADPRSFSPSQKSAVR